MASELLHLNKRNYEGLRLGLIEELEAHLHPQAQMQVIESLQNQENIQLILTTHSPNLASKVKLENLIICSKSNAFPLGKNYTKLEEVDYKFLERFLDTTKANLFFAKGLILVEGWSEEILLPALAKLLKRIGTISKDLTEAGVSVINIGSTAHHNFSKIFLRKEEPYFSLPVSIVTDTDIKFYKKTPRKDDEENVVKDENGKIIYNYEKENLRDIVGKVKQKTIQLNTKFDEQIVKSFLTKYWTLEFALCNSQSLGEIFKTISRNIHSGSNWDNFEQELARKLINKGFDKVECAYLLAEEIEKINELEIKKNDTINYLINAIKYACNC